MEELLCLDECLDYCIEKRLIRQHEANEIWKEAALNKDENYWELHRFDLETKPEEWRGAYIKFYNYYKRHEIKKSGLSLILFRMLL
jgi:hypothetical protein